MQGCQGKTLVLPNSTLFTCSNCRIARGNKENPRKPNKRICGSWNTWLQMFRRTNRYCLAILLTWRTDAPGLHATVQLWKVVMALLSPGKAVVKIYYGIPNLPVPQCLVHLAKAFSHPRWVCVRRTDVGLLEHWSKPINNKTIFYGLVMHLSAIVPNE